MEYISLSKLVNKYPTIGNYAVKIAGIVTLSGKYPKNNFIDFIISPVNNIKLDNIQSIDNTSFQFVLGIKNKSSETTPFKYFTSPSFFKKLQESINEPSPYFILQALKKEFIVEYILESDIDILKDLVKLEDGDSVTFTNHLWFLENGNVDYKKLVQYIDWVISTPKPLDTQNLGVIPVSDLLTKADYKIKKLKLKILPKITPANPFVGPDYIPPPPTNNPTPPDTTTSGRGGFGGAGGSSGGTASGGGGGGGYSGNVGNVGSSNNGNYNPNSTNNNDAFMNG